MTADLDHLRDHVDLILAVVEARARFATSGEGEATALRAAAEKCQEDIVVRQLANPDLTSSIAFERLGLSETEQQVVWLLAGVAVSREVRALLARATGELLMDPTLHAIRLVVYGAAPSRLALAELAATAPLRRLALIERTDGTSDVHESRQTWGLSPRLLELLHGQHVLDSLLVSAVKLPEPIDLPQLALQGDVLAQTTKALDSDAVVLVSGIPGLGRRTLLASAALSKGIETFEIDVERLSKDVSTLSRQLRAIARECRLFVRVPLLANLEALDEDRLALVGDELVAQLGRVFATCGVDRPTIRWNRPLIVVEMRRPTSEQLGTLWLRQLGQGTQGDAELLATKYPLAPALIHRAAAAAKALGAGGDLTPEHIYTGIRTVLDDKLGQFARRVTVTQTWDDIVLPADQLEAIAELLARVRGRRRVYEQWGFAAKVGKGLGVSALFSGPPQVQSSRPNGSVQRRAERTRQEHVRSHRHVAAARVDGLDHQERVGQVAGCDGPRAADGGDPRVLAPDVELGDRSELDRPVLAIGDRERR